MNLNKYLLKNGLVYYEGELKYLDILIEDGIIKDISANLEYDIEIDCTNKLITPSFTDVHVHLRTPGYTYKEDIESGTLAALRGGYSHICSMPNTNPCLDNETILTEHIDIINEKAHCTVIPFSAATIGLQGTTKVAIDSLSKLKIAGFSDDGKGVQDDTLMEEILIKTGLNGHIFSGHCEDESEFIKGIGCIGDGSTSVKHNLKTISNRCEYQMVARDLNIIDKIHGKHPYAYHVCHISTKETCALIRDAKALGHNVTCEVTPHHLISDQSEIDVTDSNYKMNPPLRTRDDINALIAGLNEGVIDIIATDHAPHSISDKDNSIEDAPFGIIGLELAFPLLYTYLVLCHRTSIEVILNALIDNPNRIFKIDKKLALNKDAYLNVIDLHKEIEFTSDNLLSKSSNTFYLNESLHGYIELTIYKDKIYDWSNTNEC